LNLTWFYDEAGDAVQAEKDSDGDGRTDTWFYYSKGHITKVEEDTNGDGKPDVWEEYDSSETLVRRLKDFNFDGKPDAEEKFDVKTEIEAAARGQKKGNSKRGE